MSKNPELNEALASITSQIKKQFDKKLKELEKEGLPRDEALNVFKNRLQYWSEECEYCDKFVGADSFEKFEKRFRDHWEKCKSRLKVIELRSKFSQSDLEFMAKLSKEGEFEVELRKLMKKYGQTKDDLESIVDSWKD